MKGISGDRSQISGILALALSFALGLGGCGSSGSSSSSTIPIVTSNVAVGSQTAAAGTSVTVPVTLSLLGSDAPTSIQFDVAFPADLTFTSVTTGAGTGAGATLDGRALTATTARVVLARTTNPNTSPLAAGVVANLNFNVVGGAALGAKAITISGVRGANVGVQSVGLGGTSGAVTVQ